MNAIDLGSYIGIYGRAILTMKEFDTLIYMKVIEKIQLVHKTSRHIIFVAINAHGGRRTVHACINI